MWFSCAPPLFFWGRVLLGPGAPKAKAIVSVRPSVYLSELPNLHVGAAHECALLPAFADIWARRQADLSVVGP